jgi:hypothetical protein
MKSHGPLRRSGIRPGSRYSPLRLYLRDVAGRRRLAPDQSTKRGGGEPFHSRRFAAAAPQSSTACAQLVERILPDLPKLVLLCLDKAPLEVAMVNDVAMIVGTGGTALLEMRSTPQSG